ncbi:uncharacterized protein [Lolium perenne]|uniref:uncharacterized protein n=1 Tax=Lolium perenne TaxID=4522 RepID=UPI0021F5D4A5|nr:uncharacterized protein LOC127315004 [Lolium perenne]
MPRAAAGVARAFPGHAPMAAAREEDKGGLLNCRKEEDELDASFDSLDVHRPDVGTKASENYNSPPLAKKMVGTGDRSVAGQIMSIMFNIATLALRITQTFINSAYSDARELVFESFSLLDNSVSCPKLLFTAAYHAAHTEGSAVFASVCLLGSCLIVFTIMIHLNRKYKTWARIRIVGMATLMALGVALLRYGMLIPIDHAWHTVAVPSIICSLVWLEVALLIRTQIKEDGGNQHLLRDLLMKLGETPISTYRCVHLIQNPDSPWDAQMILLLLGSGPPMLIGACQIAWLVYKADVISKVVEWLMKMPRFFAREEEHKAARPAREVDEGGRAADQVAGESVEMGSGFPILIRTCQVITFKVAEWLKKIPQVFAWDEEQAVGAATEGNGDGDARDSVVAEDVFVAIGV